MSYDLNEGYKNFKKWHLQTYLNCVGTNNYRFGGQAGLKQEKDYKHKIKI